MKYDRNTMKSLQEAYESVNEDNFYSGEDRNKTTGNPKKISNKKKKKLTDTGIKSQKQLDQMRKGLGAGSDLRDITDEVEKNCGCGETPCKTYSKQKEVEDMRSLPTRMNLIKTKLRAMGLNMSHELKGKELSEVINYAVSHYISEEGYDRYRDNILMKGGDHRSKETRERSNTPSEQPKGQTAAQKAAKGKSALELVKADITKKYGKGAIMDVKKKRKD